ncbi:hypothetical protein LTR28_008547 [Elasticomyces elasticus]|nr:hypothetical protein LTR28_008547 [Elasticomyces elasticus]
MNNPGEQSWSQSEPLDPLLGPIEDLDFSNFSDFFDIGGVGQIDLSTFPSLGNDGSLVPSDGQQLPHSPFNNAFMQDAPVTAAHDFALPQSGVVGQVNRDCRVQQLGGIHIENEYVAQPQVQQFQAQQQVQDQFMYHDNTYQQQRHHIPPTPKSFEMHGDNGHYLQQLGAQQRAASEQQHHWGKGDANVFTPVVSPAVTPHDLHLHLAHEYMMSGLSPLTSPALQAQRQKAEHYSSSLSRTSNSAATSPVDFDVNMLEEAVLSSEPARKVRRKTQPPRSSGTPSSRSRQSPIVKAHARKSTMSTSISAKDVRDLMQGMQQTRQSHAYGPSAPSTQSSSEADSVSPEPLPDAVMGPPPRPEPALYSPAFLPQQQSTPVSGATPATPASLMSLRRSRQPPKINTRITQSAPGSTLLTSQADRLMLDDIVLPEPLAQDSTSIAAQPNYHDPLPISADATPRLSARKTPKIGCLDTPSAKASPLSSALTSPTADYAPTPCGKKEVKLARAGKKRAGTTGSTLVSPALRPRISPSIKPLLPEGGLASDSTHAALLASKSNYQNLIEGTHLPGVSYPESLTTNLTSKRTSHKLAEQGRRNRINVALQELQALMPGPAPKSSRRGSVDDDVDEGSKETKEEKEARAGNSKAATVEAAIEYIRILQREKMERDAEVEGLRKRILEAEKRGGKACAALVEGEGGKDGLFICEERGEGVERSGELQALEHGADADR